MPLRLGLFRLCVQSFRVAAACKRDTHTHSRKMQIGSTPRSTAATPTPEIV